MVNNNNNGSWGDATIATGLPKPISKAVAPAVAQNVNNQALIVTVDVDGNLKLSNKHQTALPANTWVCFDLVYVTNQ